MPLPPSEYELIIGDLTGHFIRRLWVLVFVILGLSGLIITILMLRPAQIHTIERGYVVDKSSGYIERLVSLDDMPLTHIESLTRHRVNMYLLYHESYGPSLESNRDMVRRMSAQDVWDAYRKDIYALYEKWGARLNIQIRLQSLVLNNASTATVVYEKIRKENAGIEKIEKWTTTITFEYRSMDGQPVSDVDMNPSGFHVTEWEEQMMSS